MKRFVLIYMAVLYGLILACTKPKPPVEPVVVTPPVAHDSDDPAIWVHSDDPAQSLVLATDKGDDGALIVFDLSGNILQEKTFSPLRCPHNVDVEYGLKLGDETVDIAVVTERDASRLRVLRLPEMTPVDGGGIPVFEDDTLRAPMGVGCYRRPLDGSVFAIVTRQEGPRDGYLYQYLLRDRGDGQVEGVKVRAFGKWSGKGKINAIAVDDSLGYVYYSDEKQGIRKYQADPDDRDGNKELSIIGKGGFKEDRGGISIYYVDTKTGYILVSDPQRNMFRVYPREGTPGAPHHHECLGKMSLSTQESDGSDLTWVPLGARYPGGFFVAMSNDKTYHFYAWKDLAGDKFKIRD